MTTKTICIIRSNGIKPDSRVEKEAACLVKKGYNVIILAWDRDSDYFESEEILSTFGTEIPIVRLGIKAGFGQGFKSLNQFLKFQWRVFKWLIKNRNKYDAIHACDFDTAFTASLTNILLKKKFIFDIFDFLYSSPQNLFQNIIKKLQYRIINRADATIICTEERVKQISGSRPRNLSVIHNTPPKVDVSSSNSRGEEKIDDKIKVCYVGILQDWRLLKEIPQFFINHPDIEFHIGGFGKYDKLYEKLSHNYPNIKFYGRLLYDQTLKLEESCDIMLAIYDPKIDNHIYAAPNKFYESLMLAKPVIMVRRTGMSSVVEKESIGALIEYSEKGFSDGVMELIKKKDDWGQMALRMKILYKEKYSWNIMEERLDNLYSTLFSK